MSLFQQAISELRKEIQELRDKQKLKYNQGHDTVDISYRIYGLESKLQGYLEAHKEIINSIDYDIEQNNDRIKALKGQQSRAFYLGMDTGEIRSKISNLNYSNAALTYVKEFLDVK